MSLKDQFKKRLNKKEFNIDVLSTLLKEDKLVDALDGLLISMTCKERVTILCEIFNKSPFKSYKIAMVRFNEVIDQFLKGDKQVIEKYIKDLESEQKDRPVNISNGTFTYIRRSILGDAHTNNHLDSMDALEMLLGDHMLSLGDPEAKTKTISFICDIVEKKWPESKAIKVLYG